MNPIPGPLILLVLPVLAAGLIYLVRRWALPSAFLAALTSGLLSFLCFQLPLDRSAFVLGQEVAFGRPVVALGQTLILDPAGQMWLAFAFMLATVLYLLAWRLPQGRAFFPFSLIVLALYALLAMFQTLELSIMTFGISTTVAVFLIQGPESTSVRGGQRYLMVTLLSVPLLLAAAWLLKNAAPETLVDRAFVVPEQVESVELLSRTLMRNALLPTALGFGLLLAVFPFGTWMPALAADAPPLVTAFVFGVGQTMALYLAGVFLETYPPVLEQAAAMRVIQWAGFIMAVSAGLIAAFQRDFGRLLGYAALSDLGVLLLAFATVGSQSLTLTLMHLTSRGLSIALAAAALSVLRDRAGTDRFDAMQGMARRLPLATMALLLGGLGLAGFPLTGGFPAHWAVYRAVASSDWLLAALLLTSTAAIVAGWLRGLSAMLGAETRDDVARQPILASILVLALAGLVVAQGLFPQLFLGPVRAAAQAFSLF